MRTLLTSIALALVMVLLAALVGPMMVDWSSWRGYFEAELARRVGAPVAIAGPIDARLLPTPYLSFEKVTVADPAGNGSGALLRCEGMRFELAIGALAGGRLRFTEVRLARPSARFSPRAGASAEGWRVAFAELAKRVELDRVVVDQGEAIFARAGAAPVAFTDIALDASAKSLIGPFRGSGEMTTPLGGKERFQFLTNEFDGVDLPIKAEINDALTGSRATFDGRLAAASDSGANFGYDGAATFSGSVQALQVGLPSPWRLSGHLRADLSRARLDDLALSLGVESRALEATGAVDADLVGAPTLRARLQSKQLNIDAFLRHDGEESASPARAWAVLSKLASDVARPAGLPVALQLGFTAPSAFLGAQTLDQLSLTMSAKAGEPLAVDFETGLPGQSHVHLAGELEFGVAGRFRGKVDCQVGDYRALRDWAARDAPDWGARLASLADAFPYSSASAKGDVEISSVGFSALNLNLTVDRSRFTGAMAFTKAVADARARLFVDFSSDGLDVDAAPDLSRGSQWLGDLDLSLALRASKLRVARLGQATVDGGSLVLRITKTGPKLALERLSLADLGGAAIDAEGEAGPTGHWVNLRLDASRLREFAALVARVAPGRISRAFVERADLLSPARAIFEARRDGPPLEGAFPLDFVRAEGEFARGHLALKLSRAPAPVDALAADLTVDSPDGAALLRQLGAKIPQGSAGKAHLAASANGKWESGFDAQLNASMAGSELGWRGRLVPNPVTPSDPNLFGAATLKADNALNILAVLGLAAPNSGAVAPADLSADIVVHGANLALPRLSGTLGGGKVAANLSWKAAAELEDAAAPDSDLALAKAIAGDAPAIVPARLSGELSLDHATAGALLALATGVPATAKPGSRWSEAKFAPALLTPPATDLRLKIGALDILEGAPAREVSARLQIDPGKFDLDDIAMDLAGGRARGRLTLRRDGAEAALTGRIALESIGIDRPAFHGRVGGTLDFASTGPSPAAVMSGLVGQGQMQFSATNIPRLDAGALARVMAKAQMPDAKIDETNISHALATELERQPLAIPDTSAPVALNSGVIRVGPVDTPTPTGHVAATGDFDLRAWTLEVRATLEEAHADKFWSGPPPSVTAVAFGSVDAAPLRKVDVALLSAGLAAQALARETDRIATLEADMRERAYFNRRLKAEHFLARRAAEVLEFEIEQARLKSEAERKRVEDALLKARDDQLRAEATRAAPPLAPPPAPPVFRAITPPEPPARPKSIVVDPTASGLY